MPEKPLLYKRTQRHNHPGHAHFLTFSTHQRLPLLTNETWRNWIGESIRTACNDLRFDLWAYVIMPEHLHLLVHPREADYEISAFLHAVKRPAAQRVLEAVKNRPGALLQKLTVLAGGKRCLRFWQSGGGYDLNVWDPKKAWEKVDYCHLNPVKRGLVQRPDQWKWSSYRWIEMGQRAREPLKLDECGSW